VPTKNTKNLTHRIVVVVKEPNRPAETRTIPQTLEVFQEIVGGYVQAIPFADLTMLVNEDGLSLGLPENIMHASGPPLVGTVVVMRTRRGKAVTLSDAEAARAIAALTTLAL
jgi:hypothetical protein